MRMMTMQSIELLWSQAKNKLSSLELTDGEFHLVRIDDSSPIASYCGIDEKGRLFLAFRTTKRAQIPELKTIAFDTHASQRPDMTWLYVIRLLEEKLLSVFETLCVDLANEVSISKTEEASIHLLKTRVKAWEKLFSSSRDGLLSRSQVIGLIGELSMLSDLIQSKAMTISSAITAWKGPFGSDQDFIFANTAIEVKTIRDDLNEVSIASLEQLNTDRFPKIQLVVNHYRDVSHEESNAMSLNQLASSIVKICSYNPILLQECKSIFLEAGYFYHQSYDQISIAIVKKDMYDVIDEFPRLTPSSVAKGITKSKYQISLHQVTPFKRAQYPYGN
jgi:hypothetical protein